MSADNGIYIGRFPTGVDENFEYRVAHAQAIDNTSWQDHMRWRKCNEEFAREQANESICLVFGGCEVFTSETKAIKEANKIHDIIQWVEYGVSILVFDKPFPI